MLPQLPSDKANHFIYGAAISVCALGAAVLIGAWPSVPLWIVPIGAAAAAGALKEGYDAYLSDVQGHVELGDFLATTAGGISATLAIMMTGV